MDITERNEVSIAVGGASDGSITDLRARFTGNYVANGDYDLASAETAVESGYCLAVAFGRPYISNPDLAQRLEAGAGLNPPSDPVTWYGGGDAGYIDYPGMNATSGRVQ